MRTNLIRQLATRLFEFLEAILPDSSNPESPRWLQSKPDGEPSDEANFVTWLLLSLFVALWIFAGPPKSP